VLSPWLWRTSVGAGLAPAFAALRCAERHLGRWLLLAELGARAGDTLPFGEAKREAAAASLGARPAWDLVGWALAPPGSELTTRPNLELVTRLSDRPTIDGDVSFLFRLASAKIASVRSLLRHLTRGPLAGENGVRAAFHLAHDYGDERAQQQLVDTARAPRREPLRGLAAAALFDLGEHGMAVDTAASLAESRNVATLTWSCLVLTAASGKESAPLLTEPRIRRIQLGWLA